MRKIVFYIALVLLHWSCQKEENNPSIDLPSSFFIQAVDISDYPKIIESGATFYTAQGKEENLLTQLQAQSVNTIRLRLWVDPVEGYSNLESVTDFAHQLHAMGFKIWLTVHYSDTWADPSQQITPQRWANLTFDQLSDSVYAYTARVMQRIEPEYIQIGNEINTGLLHPFGHINTHPAQCVSLLQSGARAVRDHNDNTLIVLHFAGIENSSWFYDQMQWVDYDVIGLSYYPIWHGKSLSDLEHQMNTLAETFQKQIVIAETAYPFTLEYDDNTHNVVGLESHLILPDFYATPKGQKDFVTAIKTISTRVNKGIGYCYWGADLIAFDGPTSTQGSPWENQALFDFEHKALPALNAFGE